MVEHNLSYREVIPDEITFEPWKEIILNTGGTQSTLQDIKVTEKANGFCYDGAMMQYYIRNRFIYWKICHDVLELVEQSLDINLFGNRVRYKFIDTPILDGISIHETKENVIILVPTVCSVHRLTFAHPNKLHRQDEFIGAKWDLKYPSIFSEATHDARSLHTFYVFATPKITDTQMPQLACSSLDLNGDGLFILAYASGELLLVNHNPNGESYTTELKSDSIVPRFLSGLAEKFISKSQDDSIVSVLLTTFLNEIYGITLCRMGQLKFWSCSKKQCIAVTDVMGESDCYPQNLMQATQSHMLRRAVDSNNEECILAIYMCFAAESRFLILKPVFNVDHIDITRLNTLHSPERDLIEFTLTSTRIWSVWRTETGSCSVYSSCLESDNNEGSIWTPVILENFPDASESLTAEGDPHQIYLQHIFHPGRFPLHVINKALSIYKKLSLTTEFNLSISTLRQRICVAVDNEIRSELKEAEVSDEDYLECANWCWQRFYSCCVQYHLAGLKPLGLLLLPPVAGAVFLKKSSVSFLRPLETLEHMMLCSEYISRDQFLNNNLLCENIDLIDDIIKLMEVIVYLDQQFNENFEYTFEKDLAALKSPDKIIADIFDNLEVDSDFTIEVSKMLGQCHQLYEAIHKLLELLRFEHEIHFEESDELIHSSLKFFFSSKLGTSVVAKCVQQQAKIRYSICRNLLLVCHILLETKIIDWNILEAIRSVCIPDISIFTQANYIVYWFSSLPSLPFLSQATTSQKLAPFKFSRSYVVRKSFFPISLLELFIDSFGKYQLYKVLLKNGEPLLNIGLWNFTLLPYVSQLFHVLWPIGTNSIVAEWLLSADQHIWLQEYVRLLSSWCEWNCTTRSFLLGTSLLICGEKHKAVDCFQYAFKGLFHDKFFTENLLKDVDSSSKIVHYYLKVIQLFELHNAKDFAIEIANAALNIVDSKNIASATLYSIKFKHQLALKHYQKAFDSLMSNPDLERKKDNLRDLVKKLLDEKKLDVLMKFTYGHLQEIFCNIIATRARATDPICNIYYDFLYAYYIKCGTGYFRLAAITMYEQAIRLTEYNTIESLEKRVKCLLAASNALEICNEEFGWMAKPIPDPKKKELVIFPKAGSQDDYQIISVEQDIEVLSKDDIKKELEFECAKLKLARFDKKFFHQDITPTELTFLLTNAGLFSTALTLCEKFKLSNVPVFEMLTKRCVILTENDNPNSWSWLIENNLQDLPARKSPATVAWKLLHDYLNKYETESSELHYTIIKKIILMQTFIPQWLLDSYKKRNPARLLTLLHFNGRLEEAVAFSIEYLSAALGSGAEYFGLPSIHSKQSLCFPVHEVDSLLYELKLQNEAEPNGFLVNETKHLNKLFTKYLETVTRIGNESLVLS